MRQHDGTEKGSMGYAKQKKGAEQNKERGGEDNKAEEQPSLLSHFAEQLPEIKEVAQVSGGSASGSDEDEDADIGPSLPRAPRGPARPPPGNRGHTRNAEMLRNETQKCFETKTQR